MILVTVGGQMPFDRLVAAVDAWAGSRPGADVLAQIGPTRLAPRNIRWVHLFDPDEFRRRVEEAELVVGHAGMGTILTALELGRPVVVMPRRGDLRETRNDHQFATAARLAERGLVHVARDAAELAALLDRASELRAAPRLRPWASPELIETLRDFVHLRGAPAAAHPAGGAGR